MTMDWAAVTTVAPSSGELVEMDSPTAGKRVRLHRDALARLLASGDIPAGFVEGLTERGLLANDERTPEITADDLALWHERRWSLSLSYYLWSRRSSFLDDGSDGMLRRDDALRSMAAIEPCPEPPRFDPDQSIALTIGDHDHRPVPLGEVLQARRSSLRPRGGPIALEEVGRLFGTGTVGFRASRAITSRAAAPRDALISYGSAFDLYLAVYKSVDLPAGVYLFHPVEMALTPVRVGPVVDNARAALLAHPDVADASASILIVADFARYQWRYRHERALRNLWIDAGRVMQELLLAATALGMETGITPAVADTLMMELLGIADGDQQVVHTISVGSRAFSS